MMINDGFSNDNNVDNDDNDLHPGQLVISPRRALHTSTENTSRRHTDNV